MRALFSALLLLAFGLSGQAQTADYWFGFAVRSSSTPRAGKVAIEIPKGSTAGLRPGQTGELWRPGNADTKGFMVGQLTVLQVATETASVEVMTSQPVQAGDVAFLRLPAPQIEHSPYFFLVMYGIYLTDDQDQPYYSFEELVAHDGPGLRARKMEAMQRAMRAAAERWKTSDAVVEEGPKKGKRLYDVLASTDTTAVWTYLYSLVQDWTLNMGRSFRFTEAFADYMHKGDAHAPALLQQLFRDAGPEDWPRYYGFYHRALTQARVDAWVEEAKEFIRQEEYEEAIRLLEPCLFIVRQQNRVYGEGQYAYQMAIACEYLKRYREAVRYYELAAHQFQVQKAASDEAIALHYLARAWEMAGQPDSARGHYQRALQIKLKLVAEAPKASAYRESLLSTLRLLTQHYQKAGNRTEALRYAHQQVEVARQVSAEEAASAAWTRGLLYEQSAQYDKAITDFTSAFHHFKNTNVDEAVVLKRNIALCYERLQRYPEAQKEIDQGIALARTNKRTARLAYAMAYRGQLALVLKDYTRAAEWHAEAATLYASVGDYAAASRQANYAGDVLADHNKFEPALALYQKGMDYARQGNDVAGEAMNAWDHSYTLGERMRRLPDALAGYRKAFDLYLQVPDSVSASTMLSNIGQVYWQMEDFQKAIESHLEAIAFAKKCRNFAQIAKSWSKLSDLYKETNNPVAGAQALEHSITALEQLNDAVGLAKGYEELAEAYVRGRHYPRALEVYQKAASIWQKENDTLAWAHTRMLLAGVHWSNNDFAKAKPEYEATLAIYRRLKNLQGQAYALANLGALAQSADADYAKAEMYLKESISLSMRLKDESNLAYCYMRMKNLRRSQGRPGDADQYMQQTLALYKKLNRPRDIANTLIAIGYDHSYVYGDTEKAMSFIQQAQVIADTLNDLSVKAAVWETRALLAREMGDFQAALRYNDEGLALYRQVENEWGIAGIYIDKGNVYKQLSDYIQALRYQQMADSIYQKIKADYSRLAPFANIGDIYTSQGDYTKGLEYYQKSIAIMRKANDTNENYAIILSLMGESYFFLNQYTEADTWLREALAMCTRTGAQRVRPGVLAALGRLKIEEQKYTEAAAFLQEGIAISRQRHLRIPEVTLLVLQGQLHVRQKNYTTAEEHLLRASALAEGMRKDASLWEAYYWLGVLYRERNQPDKSRDYLVRSVEVIERVRNRVSGGEEARKLFSSDRHILRVYEALVDVLLQLEETDLALSYLQKNNEDNLKAKFRNLDVRFQNKDKTEIVSRERDMKARVDGLENQIAREKALPVNQQNQAKLKALEETRTIAETDYLKFVNLQVNVRPELSKYFNNSIQPGHLKGKKKQIPADMALLSYLPGETQLYIFLATSDTVMAKVVNISREKINRLVTISLNTVKAHMGEFAPLEATPAPTGTHRDSGMQPLEELYEYLISPVIQEISRKRRLCIIPSGPLSYIPFQLLGRAQETGQLRLLASDYAIFYANSTDMLLRAIDDKPREFRILAFGNPDESLPNSEKEVAEIKRLYPSTTVYVRQQATEDKAKYAGDQYNIMHFATHGTLDYEDFGKSFLTMAAPPDASEDGRLTLEELWGMDVMNHLNIVVLSACQTAVSKGSSESSPVSPASGFLQNGVKSVVATLWPVSDQATALLMNAFYKNLTGMEAIDALREAQRQVARHPDYSHPYYWAGAVLLGDWR